MSGLPVDASQPKPPLTPFDVRERHELTWLSSVPTEERRFQCCHQHFTELSIMLLGSSGASTSSRRDVLVVSRTPVGTEGVGHH